jgi:hypothetical protein
MKIYDLLIRNRDRNRYRDSNSEKTDSDPDSDSDPELIKYLHYFRNCLLPTAYYFTAIA